MIRGRGGETRPAAPSPLLLRKRARSAPCAGTGDPLGRGGTPLPCALARGEELRDRAAECLPETMATLPLAKLLDPLAAPTTPLRPTLWEREESEPCSDPAPAASWPECGDRPAGPARGWMGLAATPADPAPRASTTLARPACTLLVCLRCWRLARALLALARSMGAGDAPEGSAAETREPRDTAEFPGEGGGCRSSTLPPLLRGELPCAAAPASCPLEVSEPAGLWRGAARSWARGEAEDSPRLASRRLGLEEATPSPLVAPGCTV